MAHVLAFEKPVVELVGRVRELRELAHADARLAPELKRLEEKAAKLAREMFSKLEPMQKVQLSRHPNRPYTLDYFARLFDDFIELSGDRWRCAVRRGGCCQGERRGGRLCCPT